MTMSQTWHVSCEPFPPPLLTSLTIFPSHQNDTTYILQQEETSNVITMTNQTDNNKETPDTKEHSWENQNLDLNDTVQATKDVVNAASTKTKETIDTTKTKTKAVREAVSESINELGDKIEQKEAEMNAPPSKMDQAKEKLNELKEKVGSVFTGKEEEKKEEKKEPSLTEKVGEALTGA